MKIKKNEHIIKSVKTRSILVVLLQESKNVQEVK